MIGVFVGLVTSKLWSFVRSVRKVMSLGIHAPRPERRHQRTKRPYLTGSGKGLNVGFCSLPPLNLRQTLQPAAEHAIVATADYALSQVSLLQTLTIFNTVKDVMINIPLRYPIMALCVVLGLIAHHCVVDGVRKMIGEYLIRVSP